MKRMLIIIASLATLASIAQKTAVPEGVPARLEAINGKVVNALLQKREGSSVTFRVYGSDRDISVDQSMVKSLEFIVKYDAKAVELNVNNGDYAAVLSVLEPVMAPLLDYIAISNNMQSTFCLMMDAYRERGDYDAAEKIAKVLVDSGDAGLTTKGLVNSTLVAIKKKDLDAAGSYCAKVKSEPANLYLQACIERAKNQPVQAIQHAVDVILKHGNDMDWMPPSELLCGELYLDMGMTNSADTTFRQVATFYEGTRYAAESAKMREGLVVTTDDASTAVPAEETDDEME